MGAAVVVMSDAYEDSDDETSTAPALAETTFHTFDTEDDVDWSKFTVEDEMTPVLLDTTRVAGQGQGDTVMSVYFAEENGTMTLVETDDDYDTTWGTYDEVIYFLAKEPGTYYVELTTDNPMTYVLRRSFGIARRIAGDTRYATSVAVSQRMRSETDHPWWGTGYSPDAIVVASGENFPDALAAGPVAAYADGVVLTTEKDTLPAATADAIVGLGFTDCVLVGGSSVITSDVADAIEALPTSPSVDRIAGATRYETAYLVAQYGVDTYGMNGVADNVDYGEWNGQSMVLVSGRNFPDALSAGVMCWYMGSPMLLTDPAMLSEDVMEFLDVNGPTEEPSYVVGGEAALSPAAFDEFNGYHVNWLP